VKPPRWRDFNDQPAVIAWGVKRFREIWDEAEYIWGVSTYGTPAPKMPSRAHEMMLSLIVAAENRTMTLERVSPESEAGIREAAETGWTEPLALLLLRYLDLPPTEDDIRASVRAGCPETIARLLHQDAMSGFPKVERISPETWRLVIEFVRGERNPRTGKRTGDRGPRKKTSAQKRKEAGVHDAADYVPVILAYLREAYPEQDRRQIHDLARKIAGRIKGVEPETIAAHQKRGRNRRAL
jgi:hypothetical protein